MSLFGAPGSGGGSKEDPKPPLGGGLFGASAPAGGGISGASAPAGDGLFGASAPVGGGLFGASAPTHPLGDGPFGGIQNQENPNETCFNWIPKLTEKTKDLRVTGEDDEANPTLEVGLLLDCTSSMSSWIKNAKETLIEIINKVVEECKDEGNL